MKGGRILVTGATGFVGGQVARRLLRDLPGVRLRLLVHRTPVGADLEWDGQVSLAHGDLSRPEQLAGVCDGVDTVLHLAAKIGGDERSCRAVNTEGTRALVAEARRAGVSRFLQLGTAAVYRDGAHRGEAEGELAEDPASVTSITRLAGERAVLAAGGTVLRPHLVYGEGDTWVIPTVAEMLARIPYWVDGAAARTSMISVEDLARAVVALVAQRTPWPQGQVLHAAHPEPVPVRELVTAVARSLELPEPRGEISSARLMAQARGVDPEVWRRRLSLLTVDHYYDSSKLWRLTGVAPGPGFAQRFAECAPWYRCALAHRWRSAG
ncbi:NAD(P)-dependent oxidoreductase [Kitasatospora sp. NPDC093558]|uniref:NAD-dependent epimerase/dehydratase family protein n=1 Tax=Kitasatospora sp. NPDC093558 TaxID=3155201 RepID=UPI00342CE02B